LICEDWEREKGKREKQYLLFLRIAMETNTKLNEIVVDIPGEKML
jgi:hypothetical protein